MSENNSPTRLGSAAFKYVAQPVALQANPGLGWKKVIIFEEEKNFSNCGNKDVGVVPVGRLNFG